MTRVVGKCVSKYVSKYVSMRRLARFICIFGSNIRNLTKLYVDINIGYVDILAFHIFHIRTQKKVSYLKISY